MVEHLEGGQQVELQADNKPVDHGRGTGDAEHLPVLRGEAAVPAGSALLRMLSGQSRGLLVNCSTCWRPTRRTNGSRFRLC